MKVEKRDGSIVDFDVLKIETAVQKCFDATSSETLMSSSEIALAVQSMLPEVEVIGVEEIQDLVEKALLWSSHIEQARLYIRYRDEKTRNRKLVPREHREIFQASKQYFPTPVQEFMYYNTYSRFDWNNMRRETWIETVERVVSYLKELSQNKLSKNDYDHIEDYILNMKSMPSMRLIAMAGDAARRNNIAIYNCSYMPVDSIDSFVEALIISMSGCGVGFSVEYDNVKKLPYIIESSAEDVETHIIEDSTEGWANALRVGLTKWFNGEDVLFDYSLIRPSGSILKVKGGRASGPEPLREMLDFIRSKIKSRTNAKLSTLDAHDIMCMIGNAAVMGGTRRTAMISLFDFNDHSMRHCKDGAFYESAPWRGNANNSIVLKSPLNSIEIGHLVFDMAQGKSGEPGIFSRYAASKTVPQQRDPFHEFGTNPCGEIVLRPRQFCNLSVAVQRADDTKESLLEKVRVATMIGTIQSMATNFPGLRSEWKRNCEEERLLGVDVTGQVDSPVFRDSEFMKQARDLATSVNKEYAELLGIYPSAAITCVKPSGNSSQLLNASSGIHARWSKYYIRNIRIAASSTLFRILQDSNVPMDPIYGYSKDSAPTWVIHFPVKSPENSITRSDQSLTDQLERWKSVKLNYTDHNPSVTIYFEEDEIFELAQWIFQNQEIIGGMSFLPEDDTHYPQMPYEEISEEEYEKLVSEFPDIDFALLYFEKSDYTTSSQEVACVANSCEI